MEKSKDNDSEINYFNLIVMQLINPVICKYLSTYNLIKYLYSSFEVGLRL